MDNYKDFDNTDFLNSLLSGNRDLCSKIIQEQLNDSITIRELYESIIKETLYQVGELWEYNKISVATEHLASAIVEASLNELYPRIITPQKKEKTVIVSCLENEFHQIGIKMVSDIFELNQWNSYFLGANTPVDELISFTRIIKPDVLAISLSIYSHLPMLESTLQRIRSEFAHLPILVGGQAFQHGGQEIISNYSNVAFLSNLHSLDLFINTLHNDE